MLTNKNTETITTKRNQYTYRLSQRNKYVWYWTVTDRQGQELAGGHNQSREAAVLRCEWDAKARRKEDNE